MIPDQIQCHKCWASYDEVNGDMDTTASGNILCGFCRLGVKQDLIDDHQFLIRSIEMLKKTYLK